MSIDEKNKTKQNTTNLDSKNLLKENTSKCAFKFFNMSLYNIYNGACSFCVKWTQNIIFYFKKSYTYLWIKTKIE